MEIKITFRHMLIILLVLSWIIFIGLSIEAGSFITHAIFSLANPSVVPHLWQQEDILPLLEHDPGNYFVVHLILSIVACLKATLFYMIIFTLQRKDLDLTQPFSERLRRFILSLSYITVAIAAFSHYGAKYTGWLITKGIALPHLQYARFSGADIWLFMAVVLFIIAQIFKRGIEIQTENELTI
ncbi:DUF2975 domain-containing protein [Chitinophaga horti]|uniref:DUF2975 domain-containing protein n=1 Tax=Chitinophaga horti TaxID=2920382 RepID=A0ABY6J472_9BACT|nr:DUF2975 domain-containing protein [Chitinophaga horti]UYQ94422.1 DUF2975 domain-containing protein [Chitinophaga horti]